VESHKPLAIFFTCELQTVKMCSNQFKKLISQWWILCHFIEKCTAMDLTNWGPKSDHVISEFMLKWSALQWDLLYLSTSQCLGENRIVYSYTSKVLGKAICEATCKKCGKGLLSRLKKIWFKQIWFLKVVKQNPTLTASYQDPTPPTPVLLLLFSSDLLMLVISSDNGNINNLVKYNLNLILQQKVIE